MQVMKQSLLEQDNHKSCQDSISNECKECYKYIKDLEKRNSDWMFEMVYNDKKKVAYYFRLKNSPKDLVDGNPRYPHNYYSFETN